MKGYAKPEDLFEDLLNKPESKYPNGDAIDRFSWIVDDYTVLEQELSGISKNNGVDFRLSRVASGSNDLVGYVRYIIPNSDASTKAIKRGDLFTSVNGTKLTVSNYESLLINSDSYTLNLADYNGSAFVLNGKSVALTKTVLEENPIFINKVFVSGSHKIGYLMYNGFYSEYDDRLNQAFGTLKGQGVTDFILDLRYNGGGSIATSAKLASMITGQFDTQIFSKMTFNSKQMQGLSAADMEDLNVRFVKNLNSLNMTTVYVITTASTASASELIINGLKPYINVVQIGETTVGKNVGSFTVYDSETLTTKKESIQIINMQCNLWFLKLQILLILEIIHKVWCQLTNNMNQFWITVFLGEATEPLLSNAISKITGNAAKKIQTDSEPLRPYVTDSKILNGLRHGMYLKTAPKAF